MHDIMLLCDCVCVSLSLSNSLTQAHTPTHTRCEGAVEVGFTSLPVRGHQYAMHSANTNSVLLVCIENVQHLQRTLCLGGLVGCSCIYLEPQWGAWCWSLKPCNAVKMCCSTWVGERLHWEFGLALTTNLLVVSAC